jgi:hypothetical protein
LRNLVNLYSKIKERILAFKSSWYYPKLILLIKLAILGHISFLLLNRTFTEFNDAYIEGDGFEYALMTESIFNHGTPDLRVEDLETFKTDISKHLMWDTFPKKDIIEDYRRVDYRNAPFKTSVSGYFAAKNDKYYCYHFITYSIFNIPARWFCKTIDILPTLAFALTNSLCLIGVCALFLFYFSKKLFVGASAALCFIYGSNYWYLGWENTEVFTASCIAAGLIFLLKNRDLLSVTFVALAASQNQSLVVLLGILCFWIWWQRYNFNIKKGFLIGLIACIAILPALFYLYHFGTTNLIKDLGFLHKRYVTGNRLFGYYFDINQGLILAMPLILITYLILYLVYLIKDIKEKTFAPFIPLVCLMIGIIVISMGNWNGGAAIVHRYTTWLGAMVLVFVFNCLNRMKVLLGFSLSCMFVYTQFHVCEYFQKINKYDWQQESHNDIATWVLENHPDWYNPDPTIFSVRTEHIFDLLRFRGLIVYCDPSGKIKKVMFNKKDMSLLLRCSNFTRDELKAYKSNYSWSYLKEKDLGRITNPEEILKVKREDKIKIYSNKIYQNRDWYNSIVLQGKKLNLTTDQVLRLNAEYLIDEEERLAKEKGKKKKQLRKR